MQSAAPATAPISTPTSAPDPASAPTLCVDLDGTLSRGDSTVRMGWQLVLRRPWLAPLFPYWDHRGRARLKAEIARRVPVRDVSWHYNRALIAWLGEQRARGRRLVLASGSDRIVVAAVARQVGLFDDFVASDGTVNLASGNKAALLVQRYGAFDYVGNSKKDVAVWARAQHCYLVINNRRLTAWLRRRVTFAHIFPPDWSG